MQDLYQQKKRQTPQHIPKQDRNDRKVKITGRYMNNVLIIGWNRDSLSLCDKTKEYPALGYNVRGFITVHEKYPDVSHKEVPLLGNLKSLRSWVTFFQIREVLIAIDSATSDRLDDVILECTTIGVNYRIVSDVHETLYGHVISDIYHDIFSRKREYGIRRFLDLLIALIMMISLFPLFIVMAIAIKLESKGSIFYSQIRLGKDGKEFRIYKFRSMVQDAETKSGPVWAQKSDPRITRVGAFMRATRIDELPQLMNIFKGDMSIIGPRPERPFFVESFKEQIPLYERRLEIKPGVTGWAQVKWRYDESIEDVKEKLKYDLYYVDHNNSWRLNIKIMFLTIGTVLMQKGQ